MNYREHEVSRDHKSVLPPGGCGNKQKKGHTQAKHKKVCVIQLNHQRRELGANQKVKSGGVQGEPKSKRQAKTKIKPNMKNPSIYNIIR